MSAQLLENLAYFDDNGLPLVGGKVYIGVNGLEPVGNLLPIFSNRALTSALTNPQTLGADGIAANKIWIPGTYSLRVESVLGVQHTLDLDLGAAAISEFKELTSVAGTNSITASASPVITVYTDKQIFVLNAAGTNTTTGVTLNVDTVGAKAIVKNFNQALDPGDITANQSLVVIYNSTTDNFQWLNATVKTKRKTKGADIASASSITVPNNDGNYFDITGALAIATINGVVGTSFTFQMDAAASFTNSASLIMRGNANFTAAAGDVLEFYQLTSSTVINTNIAKADGTSVITSSPLTTKGDIYTFDTNNVRLAIGSDNQVLIADSAEATGNKWGAVSVSQGNLNTSTGEISFFSNSNGVVESAILTLPGGSYGFFMRVKHPVISGSSGGWRGTNNKVVSSTFVTQLILTIDGAGTATGRTTTVEQRFVQASPPYDLGDGDVNSFLYAKIKKSDGEIENLSLFPDPPWAYNGPTDIGMQTVKKGKKYRTIGRLRKGISLEADYPFETQSVEITNAFKNSDMDLFPHPFPGTDMSKYIIVLIDPMSKLVENLEIMKNFGGSPLDLFHNGYISIDNTKLKRGAPKGVVVYSAKMTNKLRV